MSSIALISWIESYHRRVKSNIGSHADQIDLNSVGWSVGFNQESNPRVIAQCQATLPRGKRISIKTAEFDRETRHFYAAALTRKQIMRRTMFRQPETTQ